jgi:hypothetical protein
MVPDFVALYAVDVVLFSLIYFSFASIPFLFVPFDVPEVSRLFRGLFNSYFWIVGATSLVATAVFAASGRIAFTAEMLLLAATAMAVRTRVVPRIDTQLSACKSGDAAAMRRMRQIHWGSMLGNIIIIAAVASTVPLIL